MARLDDKLTPVSPAQVLAALEQAWVTLFQEQPHRTSVLVLLAQWALETGRGSSMHCYNLGNVKSNGLQGDWCFFRCNEIINGKVKWFEPDDPACRFRAFETLDAGAVDYLSTVRERFGQSWSAVLAGDPAAYAHLLKVQRYYTADEGQYTRTVVALFSEFTRTLGAPAPSSGPGSALPDLYTELGIQTALVALGYDPGRPDGIDGPNTRAAIMNFQAQHGLVADGVVGKLTRAAIAEAWAARDHEP